MAFFDRRTPRKSFATLLALATALGACATPAAAPEPPAGDESPTSIVLMVADGAGPAYWSAALDARPDAAFGTMPVTGLVSTRSRSSRITDSAASATAYATGVRVSNGVIGMGPACPAASSRDPETDERPEGCEPLESLFEVARGLGMATGVVTTTSVLDATPAAFVAHSLNRYWHDLIAEQFATAEIEVVLGGGRGNFEAESRDDGRDLLGPLCARSTCLSTAAELSAYSPGERPLVGLFGPGSLGAVDERQVSLPAMVDAALAKLEANGRFVAVFETEGPDDAGHANRPLDVVVAEMLEFDDALARVLAYADRHPGTLVVVTADHDTGGLSLVSGPGGILRAEYTTTGHTAAMVPLYARGPGAERLTSVHGNDEIGQILRDLLPAR